MRAGSSRADRDGEESIRWMRAVLEQSPVGLLLCHGCVDRRIESNASLQQMTGCRVESIEQLRAMLRTPDGQPISENVCACARALRGQPTPSTHLMLQDARGRSTPVVAAAAPIFGVDGSVQGAVVTIQDVSATKELERLRAEWSSVVAHDLRQPLAAIALSAEAVARSTPDATTKESVERIRSAAHRLARMVGDLMDSSRLEAHRLELLRERVDIAALVRACVARAALTAPERTVDVRLQRDLPEVQADPDRVAQVVDNLLSNALKHARCGTPILVEAACIDGDQIAVAVTNEGGALSADELSRLFQRFHRTPSAKLEGIAGTGLGLYIARSLVEAHGGSATVDCTPEGRVTFRFTLPIRE